MREIAFIIFLLLVAAGDRSAGADLELQTNAVPPDVFFGEARHVPVIFHNPEAHDFNRRIRMGLWQTSSATAAPLGEWPWKQLRVPPGQTVLESAALDFPPVKAETSFLIQWIADSNRVLGATAVRVYPTNLLDELKRVVPESGENLGVLDSRGQLATALQRAGVRFVDLTEATLTGFSGRLALIGPCGPDDPEWSGLTGRIRQLARKGVAVVWILPTTTPPNPPSPSYYLVTENTNAVVVVQPELVTDPAGRPQSQLNLVYFCQLALHPQSPGLPELAVQPYVQP
jgi:hypothetical protein